jgi:hypothetical protein
MMIMVSSPSWNGAGTEVEIGGATWPESMNAILMAISYAQTHHRITPLTISGVPVAWITPPDPMPLPPLLRQSLAALDQAARDGSDGQ